MPHTRDVAQGTGARVGLQCPDFHGGSAGARAGVSDHQTSVPAMVSTTNAPSWWGAVSYTHLTLPTIYSV